MVNIMKSWKPITSGVFSIIAGMIGIGGGGLVVLMGDFVSETGGILGFEPLGVPSIILGVVALIGGIFALRRRLWIMAVIGAIFAIPCMPVLGTLALIFVALANDEFTAPSRVGSS
ncbi:MAG: hypothetical protein PHI12_03565 [Dehalococcoidales bacterium]|nr:hypothetical protein [Dehalococcoidales bacterium]